MPFTVTFRMQIVVVKYNIVQYNIIVVVVLQYNYYYTENLKWPFHCQPFLTFVLFICLDQKTLEFYSN